MINDIIIKKFKDSIHFSEDSKVLFIDKIDSWFDVATFLNANDNLKFDYLMCITSYDLGASSKFGLAYNFYSTKLKHYIEVRIEMEDAVEIK